MNCKPGDLACVVRMVECDPSLEAALRAQLIGKFVRCVSLVPGEPEMWRIADPIPIELPVGWLPRHVNVISLGDEILQPVRGVPVHDEQLDEVPAC